jgi:hypothetical protein
MYWQKMSSNPPLSVSPVESGVMGIEAVGGVATVEISGGLDEELNRKQKERERIRGIEIVSSGKLLSLPL